MQPQLPCRVTRVHGQITALSARKRWVSLRFTHPTHYALEGESPHPGQGIGFSAKNELLRV